MSSPHFVIAALIYVVPIAIGFLLLYFVIRAAVLSALRKHDEERHSARTAGPSV